MRTGAHGIQSSQRSYQIKYLSHAAVEADFSCKASCFEITVGRIVTKIGILVRGLGLCLQRDELMHGRWPK